MGAIVVDGRGEQYIVEDLLGQGGFSSVYKVRDLRTRQHLFALKELINPTREEKRNLTFEAEVLKRLNHPSLPHVYPVFEDTGRNRVYLLMDYIEGKNLEVFREEQKNKHFPLVLVILIMNPIVKALSYLHGQNPPIIHRDIKPANIIVPLEAGDAYLVDFGLAKEYVADKTTSVLRYGTPGYAAPEQYGQGTNPRTDLYGLAATIYTLLTNTVPIDALTRSVNQRGGDPLKRADRVNPALPAAIGQILERALSLRSEDRYASVAEFWHEFSMAAELHSIGGLEAIDTTPLPTEPAIPVPAKVPEVKRKQERRRSPLKVGLLILLVVMLLGAVVGVFFWLSKSASTVHVLKRPVVPTHFVHKVADACAVTVQQPTDTSYPQLARCYGGQINDVGVGNNKNNNKMFLTNIKQNQGSFSGKFQGLGLIGTFTGTMDQGGKRLRFVVRFPGRADTIVFDGSIKYGGDLRGTFQAHDQNGQASLDEYGDWSVQEGLR